MALYLGEAVRIRASATDPETGLALDPPPVEAVVDFWAPGLDRKVDDPTFSGVVMSYRTEQKDFILFQSTTGDGWIPGKWIYRVKVTGDSFENFEYANFTLKT